MKTPYPTNPKEQFLLLVEQGERYSSGSRLPSPRTLRQWRKRATEWLKQNAPKSGLVDAMLVVPPYSIQRGLAVLLRARPIVSFLREESMSVAPRPKNAKKVFIVHGRNEALKNAVARMVAKVGLEPIILHEQPNLGRTILEKFLDHADVAFAVVLLTSDDKGGFLSAEPGSLKPRARQNVILELGFFLGRLGRERVAAIFESGVEMPSDYTGVLYIPYDDAGIWSLQLAKEMKAAGMGIDLNQL